jgi:GTPase SAR1 family protein
MTLRGLQHLLQPRHGSLISGPTQTQILPSVCSSRSRKYEKLFIIRVVLVGNKADLSHDRKITTEEAREWARENDVGVCVESSAKSGDGVEDAFQRVAEEVFRKIRDGVFDLSDKVRCPVLTRSLFYLSMLTHGLLVDGDQGQSTKELGVNKFGY